MSTRDARAEILGRLVACPSVNPGPGGQAEAPFGEARLAKLLAEIVSGWGADVRLAEVSPGRPNLLARWEGRDPSRSIAFEAHSDTVGGEGMTTPAFEPVVREGRLHGRGACDAKGAMAAMLLGIRRVLDAGPPPVTVWLVSTCDEEAGGGGARALLAGGFRADAAVVGEPTALEIVHAHRGAVRWRVATKGEAAHSSSPGSGVNAIYRMRRVIEMLEGPFAEALAARRHPLLGSPCATVTMIRGGTQVNVVPARCEIEVDRRTLPGETREAATREIAEALGGLEGPGGAFTCELEETQWYPPLEGARDSGVARVVGEACGKVLGDSRFAGAGWASDAGFLAEAGIPSVVFGPGSARQAHAADEHVELADVLAAAGVYAETVAAFARLCALK